MDRRFVTLATGGRLAMRLLIWIAPAVWIGCVPPRRVAVERHPPGTLKVRFEPSTSDTSCLVASVVMAVNYVADRTRFTEPQVRLVMRRQGLSESRVADVARFLQSSKFELTALRGDRSQDSPTGIGYWLKRGYPPICIINKMGESADYNHAVVVIGYDRPDADPARDETIIYYLDPASPRQLESGSARQFEQWWSAGKHALLIVTPALE